MANANGCESVSSTRVRFCGTPLSVRRKSSAVSLKITWPPLVLTRTGANTRVERTVRVGGTVSVCCAGATAARLRKRQKKQAGLISMRHSDQAGDRRIDPGGPTCCPSATPELRKAKTRSIRMFRVIAILRPNTRFNEDFYFDKELAPIRVAVRTSGAPHRQPIGRGTDVTPRPD